jgi:rfaE bifunctional protein nucleotidyltransferase chain/domain
MKKIYTPTQAIKLAKKLTEEKKKLILAGGCFDILHTGHIQFLEKAQKYGDHMMLLLESDETVKRLKGINRPLNSQKNRARVLAALSAVDSVCLLPPLGTNKAYDTLVLRLKPAIIATTIGDLYRKQKEKQAKNIGGKVISIAYVKDQSSSRLAQLLSKHFYL